jgi:uncharacterized protein (TIGR02186 family)
MRSLFGPLLIWLATLLGPAAAIGEEIVLGLSQDEVAITATFDGSSILIFGAVLRQSPVPPGRPLDVVVTVTGPPVAVEVRRKERRFGIWVNAEAARFSRTPSFYAVASTGPLNHVVSATENLRHRITLDQAIRTIGAASMTAEVDEFIDGLVRLREGADLYQPTGSGVRLTRQTLFETSLELPANLVEGDYVTRIFLLRGGSVVDIYETVIDVRKVGMERWLYNLAHEQPAAYGVLALVIAVVAGWGASAIFRLIK